MAGKKRDLGRLSDSELLATRLCDLQLDWQSGPVWGDCLRAVELLRRRGLRLKPNFWLSTEFFVPDGMTGVALPFYLFHPRLRRLERQMTGALEGATRAERERLIWHELGHAVDNAFGLRLRKKRQQLFGLSSQKYDWYYEDQPYSRSFVRNLGEGYAQSHPDEDFAETFAVWLNPRSEWRRRYFGWPAFKKLRYMDELMVRLEGAQPKKQTRTIYDSLASNRQTLAQHYDEKRKYLRLAEKKQTDDQLSLVFVGGRRREQAAAVFVKNIGQKAVQRVAERTGMYQYKVKQVMEDVLTRCQKLELVAPRSSRSVEQKFLAFLENESRRYQQKGLYRKTR